MTTEAAFVVEFHCETPFFGVTAPPYTRLPDLCVTVLEEDSERRPQVEHHSRWPPAPDVETHGNLAPSPVTNVVA
jgi:hypothetical protein